MLGRRRKRRRRRRRRARVKQGAELNTAMLSRMEAPSVSASLPLRVCITQPGQRLDAAEILVQLHREI